MDRSKQVARREADIPEITPDNLDALETLNVEQLKALWIKLYRCAPPGRARASLMIDCLAYRIQELAFGGLALSTRTRLRKIAADIRDGKQIALVTELRIKAGTRLLREWGGVTHVVEATDDGFTYRDQRFKNLSEIAGVITGSRWSGPLFFGVKKRKSTAKAAARVD